MNTFSGEQLDAMVKYMKSFLNLARLCPEIEQTDLDALDQMISYIKNDTLMASEVADGYRAVYDRVHGMIFGTDTSKRSYPQHRVNYSESKIMKRNRALNSLVFDTYDDAVQFYDELLDKISEYDSVTVEDVLTRYDELYGPSGYSPCFFDSISGWTRLPNSPEYIVRDNRLWRLALPRPKYISGRWQGDNKK